MRRWQFYDKKQISIVLQVNNRNGKAFSGKKAS